MSDYNTILVEQRGAVTLVTLNRPQALNALNSEVLRELIEVFAVYDADDGQHCLVLTGSEKAFAAGADIKEMSSQGFADMYSSDFFAGWEKVTATRKPWLAAVAGYALGGGCEVAMMADFIIAADSAKFGQPEIKLGVTPGMGGSQRLTWAIGKAKAMEMCLTGRMMDAAEAERSGLVARVVPADVTDPAKVVATLVDLLLDGELPKERRAELGKFVVSNEQGPQPDTFRDDAGFREQQTRALLGVILSLPECHAY